MSGAGECPPPAQAALHRDRARAQSFGAQAELYDRARPRYPPALLTHLLAGGARAVLDVGCGTGIAARAVRERGAQVLGVEPDERMAAVARRHGLDVEVTRFESFKAGGRRFDLVMSAQAWHWVDPLLGAARAAEALAPGGAVGLFWNLGRPAPALRGRIEGVYARLEPGLAAYSVLLGESDERLDSTRDGLAASGRFGPAALRFFTWRRRYTTAEWLAQVSTHSDHHALVPARRAALLDALAGVIDDAGGAVEMTYRTALVTARLTG